MWCERWVIGVDSDFLKAALSMPWRLSTSQQPQQQQSKAVWDAIGVAMGEIPWQFDSPADAGRARGVGDAISPGGGFGPVDRSGYGVSYMVAGACPPPPPPPPPSRGSKQTRHVFRANTHACAGDNHLFFHISSQRSGEKASAARFEGRLREAFGMLSELFDAGAPRTKA